MNKSMRGARPGDILRKSINMTLLGSVREGIRFARKVTRACCEEKK